MKLLLLMLCVVVGSLSSNAQECDHHFACRTLRDVAEDACATHDTGEVIEANGGNRNCGAPDVAECEIIMRKVEELRSPGIDALGINDNETEAMTENLKKSLADLAEKTERGIENLMIRNNKAMEMLKKLKESVAMLKKDEEFCKVYYEGKCFWHVRQRVTFAQAQAVCAKIPGGQVARIYNEVHYQQILVYMRSLMTESMTFLDAWLGMKFDPSSGEVVILPEETEAPFVTWYPRYPSFWSPYTHMIFEVNQEQDSLYQGMFNQYPTWIELGVLCEA